MWSASIVIILFILKLTHVNTQDNEFSFNVTTNKTHAVNFFDTSTSKTFVKEELFDASVSKTPEKENSFDTPTNTLIKEDSFDASTSKILVEADCFDTPISNPPLEEDSYNASTAKSSAKEDSYNPSTTETLVKGESFDESVSESPVREDSFNQSTTEKTAKENFLEASASKTLIEEDSLNVSTTEAIVEESFFDIPSSETSISNTLTNEDSFRASTSETLTKENFCDTPTCETPIADNSFEKLTSKTLVEENSYDTLTTETTVEEDSFDTSTNQTLVKEDSSDLSISKTLVEEDSFEASTEATIEEDSFDITTSKTLLEVDLFEESTTEATVEESSFDIMTSKTLIEVDLFEASTTEATVEEDSFDITTSKTLVEVDSFDASTTETNEDESFFDASTSKVIVEEDSFETTTSKARINDEAKMSTYILKVIEHYKQPDPQGFPGAKMPDPLLIPDSSQFIAFGTNLDFTDTTLHGVNKFHIVNVTADIGKMECRANFEMDILQVRGKYSLNTWLSSYPGGFVSDISGLKSEVIATLGVEQDGKLRAQDISIDITFKNITIQFENAGFLSSMLQGLFDSMGSIMYDTIKSYLLKDARTNMKDDINKKLDQIVGDIEFPNTISPMDMILVDVRKKIKDMKMDPLCIEDYVSNIGMFTIALNNTKIKGLSTFQRVGNITLRLENNTAVSDFNIGTKELQGLTNWEVSGMNGLLNKTGSFSFSVEYIQGRFVLAQAMDTRKTMKFTDFQLDVGNIQIRSDGTGTLDYIIEISANILPSLLRYQIIAAIENPIKWKIQQELDRINVEEAITNELPRIDKIQEDGFQLAELRRLNSTGEINFDDDEFFNF